MRVLATAGRKLGRRTDAECSYLGLIHALRLAGVTVEQGLVAQHQDLSRYDLILVEVPNPSIVGEGRFIGAMWALSGTTAPAVAIYDHWAMSKLHERLKRVDAAKGRWLGDTIEKVISHQVTTAVNAFPWGNRNGIEWGSWFYDPSMLMVHPITYRSAEPRERKLVLATYEDHRKWIKEQRFVWPVEEYGRASHGRKMIELPDLMKRYTACWGAIIPPYTSLSGSGYWRNRVVHMAQVRSLFIQGFKDSEMMGDLFSKYCDLDFFKMTDQELGELAELQSRWVFERVWSVEKFTTEALAFVEGAAA